MTVNGVLTCFFYRINFKVDHVQKGFIKLSETKKKEKEQKKLLDSKSGGYLDEMDLPPTMSDDEGGEWVEEDEEEDVALTAQITELTGLNHKVGSSEAVSSEPSDGLDLHTLEGLKISS